MAKREVLQLTNRRYFEHLPPILLQRRKTKARKPGYTYEEPDSDADDEEQIPNYNRVPKKPQKSAYLGSSNVNKGVSEHPNLSLTT
jgi:hypothetical protein